MTRPERPTAALTRLERRTGVEHGPNAFDVLAALGYVDALEHAHHAEADRAERAARDLYAERGRTVRLRAAVGALIDRVDPDDPGALIEFLRALDGLLGRHGSAPGVVAAVRLGELPSPGPRRAG